MDASTINALRRIRLEAEVDRKNSRADVARELSIAITSLEDAELRLRRARVRLQRNPHDAEQAVAAATDELIEEQLEADEAAATAADDGEPEKEGKQK